MSAPVHPALLKFYVYLGAPRLLDEQRTLPVDEKRAYARSGTTIASVAVAFLGRVTRGVEMPISYAGWDRIAEAVRRELRTIVKQAYDAGVEDERRRHRHDAGGA